MLAQKQPIRSVVYIAIGVGAAIVGLLPWIVTGMRLPLQNLWAADTLPAQMPIALLPFSQYFLSTIVALFLIGSAIAGIVGRATTARRAGAALGALIGGVLLVQVAALVQSAIVVSGGLSKRTESTLYLVAIVGGAVVSILLGVGMLALIARAPKAGALVALSIAGVAFGSWLVGAGIASSLVWRFGPAVIIGAAIVWCGVGTVGRVIAAVVSLLLLWVGPTLVTAVSAAAGSRVMLRYPLEMLDYGANVFRSALGMPELWGPPLALAVAIAVIGLVARRVIRRPASVEPSALTPPPPPPPA